MTDDTPSEMLRSWARGINPLSAATELLIRGGFAQSSRPWVLWDEDGLRYWIDFESIPDLIGALSGGEQRFLRIAASLGAGVPVDLSNDIAGLDREHTRLVLAAIAQANGMHMAGKTIEVIDEQSQFVPTDPLFSWPE